MKYYKLICNECLSTFQKSGKQIEKLKTDCPNCSSSDTEIHHLIV